MASSSSDLRTRMSAGNYKLTCEIVVKRFKERKVEISDAIKTSFPFLETLRDHKLITNKMYKESKASCENPTAVPKAVYAVLDNMKETCHLQLLEILFSEFMMKNYPDLHGICKGFKDVVEKNIFHQGSVEDESAENRNTQLSIEQGTGENTYPFLSWLFPDQSNYTVTSSEDSLECRNREKPPKASTSALKRKPESMNLKPSTSGNKSCKKGRSPEAPSGLSAEEKRPEAGSSAVRSGADQGDSTDLGNNSASQKPKKKRESTQQPGVSVNFRAEILPVACGEMKGLLIKRKLERGATRKCIKTEDGNWLTPREFEVKGGCEKASNWKTSLTCGGKTLKQLMELGFIPQTPVTHESKKKEENSDKCKICQDGGKLICCENCQSFFHGDCHLPPVDTKRKGWNCTFCTVENSSRSQQYYKESEVLVQEMDAGRKLKCEFLLLKVYHHLESNIFPHIPRGSYVTKASQYLGKLRTLDPIKTKLIMNNYGKVEDFMKAMNKFFHDPRREKLHLNQEEFMKNFKKVFAIQETN